MEIVRIRSGGLHGTYRKFNSAIWFNKLAAHHEEDEKLKNDVDERGHVDPGINTAFSGNHYILDGRSLVAGGVDEVAALFGEEAFAEVRGEFVEIVDKFVDPSFKDSGHSHGWDGYEEAGDSREEPGPNAISKIGRCDAFSQFGYF